MSKRMPYWPSFHGRTASSSVSPSATPSASPSASHQPAPSEAEERARCLRFITGYGEQTVERVKGLIERDELGAHLLAKHPTPHEVNTNKLLRAYVMAIKDSHLRSSPPLSKVCFDDKLHLVQHALGTHTFISRPQGGRLKAKRELRISSLFKRCPEPLLRMIVVHELAHLRDKEHSPAFYQLCVHMEPRYHQLEFEARLYLIYQELYGSLYPREQLQAGTLSERLSERSRQR